MEFLLLLIQIPFLVYLIKYIRKQQSDSLLVNSYYYLLSLKVTSGLFLGILYFNYYKGGDTLAYYQNLDLLSGLFKADFKAYFKLLFLNEIPVGFIKTAMFGQPRTYFFIRLMSPFYILSASNYWLLAIYLSIFSFSGLWALANTLIRLFKLNSLAVVCSFFLFPTVVFWSSGLLKDSLIMGIMGYSISIVLVMTHEKPRFLIFRFFLLIVFSWILFEIKFYYFAVLFAILIPYSLTFLLSRSSTVLKNNSGYRVFVLMVFVVCVGLLVSLLHPLLHVNTIAAALYDNYNATLVVSKGHNIFLFEGIRADAMSFVPHIPKALCNGLFGPYLWQCKKIISLVTGIENTFLLILFTTFVLVNFKKDKIRKIDIQEISVILYVSILAVFMAIASPNWGTLVRYKIGYLPFFLLLILNKNPFIHQLEERFKFLKPPAKKE